MPSNRSIHHVMVAIPPQREEEARHFCGDLLGLSELQKPETLRDRGGLWFDAGNVQLHLGVDRDFKPATKAHIAIAVEEIETVRERLADAGFPPIPDTSLSGFDRSYVDDPFGNRVEILEPLA
jgi:catechol 2,3-dioxygenase-like lactoylglutathione lyase family enzyme